MYLNGWASKKGVVIVAQRDDDYDYDMRTTTMMIRETKRSVRKSDEGRGYGNNMYVHKNRRRRAWITLESLYVSYRRQYSLGRVYKLLDP